MHDITIIGGGPAGCRLAMLLAKSRNVLVIEEHGTAGRPLQCAGLVSPRTIDPVTKKSALVEIKDFKLHSPGGRTIELHSKKAEGVVIDRSVFDLALADKAADNGAEFIYAAKATDLEEAQDRVTVACRSERRQIGIDSSLLIGADGPRSIVRSRITKKTVDILYRGAQFEGLDASSDDGTVEMWIGNKVAPGFFAWKIPTGDSVRVGLCSSSEAAPMSLLKTFAKTNFPELKVEEKQVGLIPVGPVGKLSKGRLALIGDAGGQTKPITGGGVYLGKRAAEILAESIGELGLTQDALCRYERSYGDEFGSQISRAWLIRKVINRLTDKKMDRVVEIFSEKPALSVLERSGDIDNPAGIASEMLLKAPRLLQFAPVVLRSMGQRNR